MNGVPMANGHRPVGLMQMLHPELAHAPRPDRGALAYDLDRALSAIVRLHATVSEECITAQSLGSEREGSGIVIDDNGLILTIGYLIVEARDVTISILGRPEPVAGEAIAYDHETGLGMIRALAPLDLPPLPIGSADGLAIGDPVTISSYGGYGHAVDARIVGRQEFAGPWEYLLEDALYTAPMHPYWGGSALIGPDGALAGVGSLYLETVGGRRGETIPGNMFVRIDELLPIYDDMVSDGRVQRPPRPWVGMHVNELDGRLYVTGVTQGAPADRNGVRAGDIVLSLDGVPVGSLTELYRTLWGAGEAGVEVRYTMLRDDDVISLRVTTGDRYAFLDLPRRH